LTNGQTYVGIDALHLKVANQYGFPFLVGMADHLPFRDNSFDSAVCIATLDHVADPAMVISESLRILRPGGVLGIMNKGDIQGGRVARYGVYLRLGLRKLRYGNLVGLKRGLLEVATGAEDDFHMHNFDRESLSTLCESGFQDIDTQMVGNTLFLRAIKPTFSDRRL